MSALQSLAARRFGVVAVSTASLIVCCALAWWQWERYSSAGGSFQNLGYVLQWPLFGLFPAFVFLRMRKLRAATTEPAKPTERAASTKPAGRVEPATASAAPDAKATATTSASRSRWLYRAPQHPVAADTDGEPDDVLAEYNRYLAELNQRDQTS